MFRREDEACLAVSFSLGKGRRRILRTAAAERGLPAGKRIAFRRHDGARSAVYGLLPVRAGSVPDKAVRGLAEGSHARHVVDELEAVLARLQPVPLGHEGDGRVLGTECGRQCRPAGGAVERSLENLEERGVFPAESGGLGEGQGAENACVPALLGNRHRDELGGR